jgi:hypothetical protein
VTPERESAYLAERGNEAQHLEDDGDHLWVFQHESHSGVYLEFRESVDPKRLAGIDPTADIWREVELDADAPLRRGQDTTK